MNEVIEILVWPATVIIVVLILRQPIAKLLQTTKKLKYKELEVEFRESIEKLQAEAQEILPDETPPGRKLETVQVDLNELAAVSPTAAVVEAWKSIEISAKAVIQSKGDALDYDVATPYELIQHALARGKLMDERHGKLFNDLRQLRNKIVHAMDYTFSEEQAKQYIDLSIRLRNYLDELASTP